VTTVRDAARGVFTTVRSCKDCQASVYRSRTGSGKVAWFNVDVGGNPTRVLHATTCLVRHAGTATNFSAMTFAQPGRDGARRDEVERDGASRGEVHAFEAPAASEQTRPGQS